MLKVGKLYEDVVVGYFVVIKILETNNDGFEFEIVLSDKKSQTGEKYTLSKRYEKDFVLYNPNPKVRRLE